MNFNQKLNDLGYLNEGLYKNLYLNNKDQVPYSDGDIEEVIFNELNNLPDDKFKRYRILENAIVDWPTKYHFTWERINILKPINFNTDDSVLELGGGTGILSEYICNKVKKLVTIEGTLNRAKSVAARCKYYNNIDIVVANFLELDMLSLFGENSFDKITLIGVMEYVPKFSDQENPIVNLLKICNKLVKKDGELIIAIENKIGLKYLLGYQEDHNAKAYYGPQSFYKKNDVTTFSRAELTAKLSGANFNSVNYYFPFPDYKLPNVIIKDCEAIYSKQGSNLITNLLYDCQSQNYSGLSTKNIHEGRILANFINDKSLDVISNSFLLIARKQKKEAIIEPFVYYFANNRRYEYANEIRFFKNVNSIKVLKEWYAKATNNNVLNLVNEGKITSDFIEGNNVHINLDNYYLLNDKEAYNKLFADWLVFLKRTIEKQSINAFDMMPFNTIVDLNNELRFIDIDEWQSSKSLSVSQVASRYIISNKIHFEWLLTIKKERTDVFLNDVLTYFKLPILTDEEIYDLEVLNIFLKNNVFRRPYINKKVLSKNSRIQKLIKRYLPYRLQKRLK
ncbi:MAG: class I SAM-dependent methyltransferase [Winogradskyella sp.]|uniref:class I SAM-dependent methyltransferase n=1 Tax=Winogradskyella sp. TaxID=1883156 RepID=UPI00385861C9